MTLLELQDVLSANINMVNDTPDEYDCWGRVMDKANATAVLAKQMINNANVILKSDCLIAEGKASQEKALKIVGD